MAFPARRYNSGAYSAGWAVSYGHLWPDKDESTKAVIDALVDSKFGNLACRRTICGPRKDRRSVFPGQPTRKGYYTSKYSSNFWRR